MNNDWVAGAATPADKSKTKLVEGHAYAVLGVYNVNDRYNNPVKLVKCFNPWGSHKEYPENPWG